jgi:hypothetical protein
LAVDIAPGAGGEPVHAAYGPLNPSGVDASAKSRQFLLQAGISEFGVGWIRNQLQEIRQQAIQSFQKVFEWDGLLFNELPRLAE